MSTDLLDADPVPTALTPALRRYLARLCGWCACSLVGRRSDAHYCTTAHRCAAWRARRAAVSSPNLTEPHRILTTRTMEARSHDQ